LADNIHTEAVFLSAGVPDPRRCSAQAKTANSAVIASAVLGLIHTVLGRRPLVWGGHPAITPMIAIAAERMGMDCSQWVTLYQSRYFESAYPADNDRFRNVSYVDAVRGDVDQSLRQLRLRMFASHQFSAAVFIGGMQGIVDEFDLFQRHHLHARVVPLLSTGGATAELSTRLGSVQSDLQDDLDYVGLFHRHLGILMQEKRYPRPEDQPTDLEQRVEGNATDSAAIERRALTRSN
jgi:hypothetical protein